MEELELRDYYAMLKRRKKYAFSVFLAVLALSVVFAFKWSNYRSSATLELAPSEIQANTARPMNMNASESTESTADTRISHIQQTVTSTSSLIDIITKYNLYPDARKNIPIAAVAENMSKKIKIELVSSSLASSLSSRSPNGALSAITFSLSFEYNNPVIAQQVANELVTRFLDEDLKERRNAAHQTSAFLDAQIKALEASMGEQGKRIADFRASNGSIQPESMVFNEQAAQATLFTMQNIDAQLMTNEGTQGTLNAQLATVDPYSRVIADGQVMTTPSIQLKALKSQLATLSAQYGPDHPDVVKTRHQIEALEKQTGLHGRVDTGALKSQINDTETNLAGAEKTYGPNHPDVIALHHKLTELKAELATSGSRHTSLVPDADNPAYLQLSSQLQTAEEQHKSLLAQKQALQAQQNKYQNAIAANPGAEQKLAELSRDYENSQQRYRELKEKKMAADMSETIEEDRNGQKLVIIDPPQLPLQTQPARHLFVLGGLFLALFCGLATAVGMQVITQSIVGPRHLEALTGMAPLVVIPHLLSGTEASSRGTRGATQSESGNAHG